MKVKTAQRILAKHGREIDAAIMGATAILLVMTGAIVSGVLTAGTVAEPGNPSFRPLSGIAVAAGESAGEFASTAAAILATPDPHKRCVRALDKAYVAVDLCEPLLSQPTPEPSR